MDKIDIKKLAKKQTKSRVTAYAIIVGTILIIYTLSMAYIVGWGFMNTFKTPTQFGAQPAALPDLSLFQQYGVPGPEKGVRYYDIFANYKVMFASLSYEQEISYITGIFNQKEVYNYINVSGFEAFLTFLWNSALTMFAGTFLPLYLCCIMGYLTVNYKYKFSGFIYALVLFTMIIPIIGSGSSMLNLQQSLGIYDNMIGFFIWNCQFTSMYFLIMFSFFQGLSTTYFEAAEIDGASQLRMIIAIAIPMANTMIWAGIVSLLVTTWNDYMTPLTYLPSYPTLAFGIFRNTRVVKSIKSNEPAKIAALFVLALPAVVFFTAFRKKLMGNISIGGIKG
ncbi:MAG: carbohydrate ABC transporter permease [Clostridiales bacterium]|nr:carbohydrate ABC transporter permease [Clostridiales bacterium]